MASTIPCEKCRYIYTFCLLTYCHCQCDRSNTSFAHVLCYLYVAPLFTMLPDNDDSVPVIFLSGGNTNPNQSMIIGVSVGVSVLIAFAIIVIIILLLYKKRFVRYSLCTKHTSYY